MDLATLSLIALFLAAGIELLNLGMASMRSRPLQFADFIAADRAGCAHIRIAQFALILTWPLALILIAIMLTRNGSTYP